MNEVDQAKLLAALLGVLKNENSKAKKALAEELSQELQDLIDQQSGTQYLQVNEEDDPVPIQVFRGRTGEKGPKGPKGPRGDSGSRGLSGPQGPMGNQGSIGPMGPQGLTGPEGKEGPEGRAGKDGETPDLEPFKIKITGEFEQFTRNISSQITRMAYASGGGSSSGGGEVRLAGLDDIDMSTLDGDKFLRYNSATQKFQFSDPVVVGDLLPAANNLYRIGSPEMRWKELWLTGNTIFLGSAQLKVDEPTGSVAVIPDTVPGANTNAIIITQKGAIRTAAVSANGSVSRSDFDRFSNSNNQTIVDFTQISSNAAPVSSNTFNLGNPGREWKDLHLGGSLFIGGQEALNKSTLDGYLQVSNANVLIQNKVDKYLQVSNTNFATQSDLDKYIQTANLNLLSLGTSIVPATDNLYDLGSPSRRFAELYLSGNSVYINGSTVRVESNNFIFDDKIVALAPDLDRYLQVANANVLIQNKVDNYLQVANTGPLVLRPELDQYLQIANANFTTQTQLDKYLQVSNANFATQADLDRYLQVSNANSVTPSQLSQYLQVANTTQFATTSDLDNYLQVANSSAVGAATVANTAGSGTSLVESTINNIINFKSFKAGSNITLQDNNGEIVINATGSLSVQDTLDFGFVSNDFGLITDGEESDPQYDFGTL